MNHAIVLQLAFVAVLAVVVCVTLMLPRIQRAERLKARLLRLGNRPSRGIVQDVALPKRIARSIGESIIAAGIVQGATLAEIQRTVFGAGFRGQRAVAIFVGTKVLLMVLLPLLLLLLTAGMFPMLRNLLVAGAAIAGLILPDMLLRRMRENHKRQVERGLPDALDLMVICAEAGLPLEAAMERVATEMAESNRAVAGEFAQLGTELRIFSDRRQALQNMGQRTGLGSLGRLGGTLAQTLEFGTPMSQALRTLAMELRHETLMRFEARAARLPALLTIPTIAFILPCIFLVVGGPAVIRVLDLTSPP